jgi:hypothetical protein
VISLIQGCSETPVVYRTIPLPMPLKPILPTVKRGDLACLDDVTYKSLAVREMLLRKYIKECDVIIKSTHNDGKDDN